MRIPRFHPFMLLCLAGLLLPLTALAQTRVDERHALGKGGRVELENVAGNIVVRGWDRDEVTLVGDLGGDLRLDANASRDRVQFRVIYPSKGNIRDRSARLELRVPRGAELQVTAVSADVDIADIDLRRLQARSVSGKVTAAGRSSEAELASVSGAVQAQLATSRLKASSVSGQVRASGGVAGDVAVETVSGSLDLDLGRIERLQAESVSGSVKVRASALAPGGRIGIESVSGRVALTLPADSSAELRVSTFSGGIESPVGTVEKPAHGPGRRLETRLGQGNGDIAISSHSGGVVLTLPKR